MPCDTGTAGRGQSRWLCLGTHRNGTSSAGSLQKEVPPKENNWDKPREREPTPSVHFTDLTAETRPPKNEEAFWRADTKWLIPGMGRGQCRHDPGEEMLMEARGPPKNFIGQVGFCEFPPALSCELLLFPLYVCIYFRMKLSLQHRCWELGFMQ